MWGWLKSRGTRPGTAARGASTTGMENTLVRTLAAGIRVRSGNRKGQVLHAYVQSLSPSVAGTRAIVAGGVAVDSTNRDGDTPLLIAARGGREPIVRTLIGLGANAYHRNRQGRTALHEAAGPLRDCMRAVVSSHQLAICCRSASFATVKAVWPA